MAKKNNNQVSAVRQAKHGWIWTLAFTVISILWIAPILVVLLNSFKRKAFIFRHPFTLGTEPLSAGWDKFIHGVERAFCGWLNYSNGVRKTNFWNSFGISLFITVGSVALIIICCSMCAWYITRVHTTIIPRGLDRCKRFANFEAMWVWNDYLLPSLVLNINKYKTIPIAIQFLKQSHGQIDWGAMMAVLVLAILPIIIFYIACQKYIIEGVLAGAVKG